MNRRRISSAQGHSWHGVLLLAAGLLLAGAEATRGDTIPTDGMVITTDTTLAAGTYFLPNGLIIGASGITVQGNGTTIIGNGGGYGITATNRNNVTLRNLTVRSYFHGLHLYNCDDLTIENCNVWDTPELPEGTIFLDIFDGPNGGYAHAMWLRYCDRAVVRGNNVANQQNGISLFDCTFALVENNEASFNTGWGIYFYATDDSIVRRNTADYCTRDYFGWSGADAASFLIVYGSDRNDVTSNSFVGGGDGVFLAGATHNLESRPNNFNYFAYNDCSDSPNNGFEATFSQGNVFEHNISDRCNYGYWLGYSFQNELRYNQANACATAGVAIEHGRNNIIEYNTFADNGRGIYLWTDADASLVAAFPAARDSYGYSITGNTITGNTYGILCEALDTNRFSYDYTIVGNTLDANVYGVLLRRTTGSLLRDNFLRANTLRGLTLENCSTIQVYNNRFENDVNAVDNGSNSWSIAKTAGTNIVGGPFLGGNYWADYTGVDLNGDGLGDTAVPYNAGGNISSGGDERPLVIGFDSDGDGLNDEWELQYFGDLAQDADGDPDGDGLLNVDEYIHHTNPTLADTDGDGLEDGYELQISGTAPDDPDSDDDGLLDGDEITLGANPHDPDSDDDGIPDGWEAANGLDVLVDDADTDGDNDGLTAYEEWQIGADPRLRDSDSDGLEDGAEASAGSHPSDAHSFPLAWSTLASDPSYFPYADVVTPPSPNYWPRANLSVAAGNGRIYSAGGYGPRDYIDTDGTNYPANRQSGFSIFNIAAGTWVSANWNGAGPTPYNNGNGTAGATESQGTYTGNNQAFVFDRDGDGTEEFFVFAGYPIWDGGFAIYDPNTDAWTSSAPRSFGGLLAGYFATALLHGSTAYVYGGIYNGPDGNGLFTYDILANTWAQLPNGPVRLKQHCGEIIGDTMYLISGQQDNVDYGRAVVTYDIPTGTWDTESAAPIPTGVNRAASVAVGDEIFVVGGIAASGASTTLIQVYDTVANTWRTTFPMPAPRSRHGAVVVDGTLYVVGGYGPGASGEENKSDLWAISLDAVNRPRVVLDGVEGEQRGRIAIGYQLYDVNASTCTVQVEYSTDGGGTWHAATAADGAGMGGLASALTGVGHAFVWDSGADLGFGPPRSVRVRLTPADEAAGTPVTSDDIVVHNVRGDLDLDGDFDLADFAGMQRCFGGAPAGICDGADLEVDGDIDLADYAVFAEQVTGPQ